MLAPLQLLMSPETRIGTGTCYMTTCYPARAHTRAHVCAHKASTRTHIARPAAYASHKIPSPSPSDVYFREKP